MDAMTPEEARAELARLQAKEKREEERRARRDRMANGLLLTHNALKRESEIWLEVYLTSPEEERAELIEHRRKGIECRHLFEGLIEASEQDAYREEEKRAARRRLEERAKEAGTGEAVATE